MSGRTPRTRANSRSGSGGKMACVAISMERSPLQNTGISPVIYITIADITDFAEREKALRERIDALQDLLH